MAIYSSPTLKFQSIAQLDKKANPSSILFGRKYYAWYGRLLNIIFVVPECITKTQRISCRVKVEKLKARSRVLLLSPSAYWLFKELRLIMSHHFARSVRYSECISIESSTRRFSSLCSPNYCWATWLTNIRSWKCMFSKLRSNVERDAWKVTGVDMCETTDAEGTHTQILEK